MAKSPDAFRTISEVAEWLDVPTHVLRFWESRFSQIKPVKRAGGRRYYRPADMQLIGGIKVLLHDDGLTIRGVQKLLRENGIKHVAGFSPALETDETPVVETAENAKPEPAPPPAVDAVSDAPPADVSQDPAPVVAARPDPTPAAAATLTHDAAPDPSPDPDPEFDPRQVEMFPSGAADTAAAIEERDVPDEAAEGAPGAAAALMTLAPSSLSRHGETLRNVAERLAKLKAGRGA